jgi:hypothetical protein
VTPAGGCPADDRNVDDQEINCPADAGTDRRRHPGRGVAAAVTRVLK